MIGKLDNLCDMMGLEYSEEFSDNDIYYELYRSSDDRVLGHADTLLQLYQIVKRIANLYC